MKTTLLILMAVVMVGCASYDWSSEVGTYTLDRALVEFGPPDATSKLDSGGVVVSWTTGLGPQDQFLKRVLQFDKDGKLVTGRGPAGQR
jgi:hypothetical protein